MLVEAGLRDGDQNPVTAPARLHEWQLAIINEASDRGERAPHELGVLRRRNREWLARKRSAVRSIGHCRGRVFLAR